MKTSDPFEREGWVFEIENEADLMTGNRQITQGLGDVWIRDEGRNLGFDDDFVFHDQVGDEFADVLAFVEDWELLLLGETQRLLREFDTKGVFVDGFIEAGPKSTMHSHRRTDDFLGEVHVWVTRAVLIHL